MAIAIFDIPKVTAEEATTLTTVLDVWRKREAATKSLKIEMAEDHLIGKGTLMGGGPPADMINKLRRVVIIDGDNMRHERTGEVWSGDAGAPDFLTMYAVNDGKRCKQLFRTTRNDDVLHSTGFVENRERHADYHNIYLAPLLWHFRPLTKQYASFDLERLAIVSDKAMINGTPCLLIEEPVGVLGRVRRYWVSPDQDMGVVRYSLIEGDLILRQVDVTHRHDPKHGWLPSTWKAVRFNRENMVVGSGTLTVTSCETNIAVPKSTFDIVFPPGVDVQDRILKKRYIVRPDGTERQIMQREIDRGATYSELVATAPGFAGKMTVVDSGSRIPLAIGVMGFLVIVVGMLVAYVGKRR